MVALFPWREDLQAARATAGTARRATHARARSACGEVGREERRKDQGRSEEDVGRSVVRRLYEG